VPQNGSSQEWQAAEIQLCTSFQFTFYGMLVSAKTNCRLQKKYKPGATIISYFLGSLKSAVN